MSRVVSLRRRLGGWVVGGGHLVILIVAAHIDLPAAWPWALLLIAAISFVAWIISVRRWNAIGGTPTSNVASSAQGYVELMGMTEAVGDVPLLDPVHRMPCAWYRVELWRRSGSGKNRSWSRTGSTESDRMIGLRDRTGLCLLDLDHAEFLVRGPQRVPAGVDREHRLWRLPIPGPIYALGEFRSAGPTIDPASLRRELDAVMTEWKQDRPALLARFDADGNGELDPHEWERARQAVQAEAKRRASTPSPEDALSRHRMGAPEDGRLYLISDRDPADVASRFRWWAWAHLAIFCAGLGAALWLFRLL
ncbi:MAG: hypothetical protein KIT73_04085 [Burkholderiales bacterium]|nr:hypothetical protein [Burkholderiales bacterium]